MFARFIIVPVLILQVVLPASLTPEQVANLQKIIPRKPLEYNASTVVACTLDKVPFFVGLEFEKDFCVCLLILFLLTVRSLRMTKERNSRSDSKKRRTTKASVATAACNVHSSSRESMESLANLIEEDYLNVIIMILSSFILASFVDLTMQCTYFVSILHSISSIIFY
jgi:hypothetical protein